MGEIRTVSPGNTRGHPSLVSVTGESMCTKYWLTA